MVKMNDEQRYSAVLKELGEVLQSKNTTISCQAWQIDQLKEKLAAAEAERDKAIKRAIVFENELQAAVIEIETLKGGAA